MEISLVALLCIVSGGLINTAVQFLSVIRRSETQVKFDQKYVATLLLSMIATVIAAFNVFLLFPIPPNVAVLYVAASAIGVGYLINNGANLAIDTVKPPAASPFITPESAPVEIAPAEPPAQTTTQPTPEQTPPTEPPTQLTPKEMVIETLAILQKSDLAEISKAATDKLANI